MISLYAKVHSALMERFPMMAPAKAVEAAEVAVEAIFPGGFDAAVERMARRHYKDAGADFGPWEEILDGHRAPFVEWSRAALLSAMDVDAEGEGSG